jgi:hypothetical protein
MRLIGKAIPAILISNPVQNGTVLVLINTMPSTSKLNGNRGPDQNNKTFAATG